MFNELNYIVSDLFHKFTAYWINGFPRIPLIYLVNINVNTGKKKIDIC